MPATWILRALLALLALEAGICTVFLAEEWGPLRVREESLFRHFLSASRMGQQFVVDESPNRERIRIARPVKTGKPHPILRVDVDEDPQRYFESYPLRPEDWTVIVTNARSLGTRVLAIESPLTWEDAGELQLRTLDRAIGEFDQAVLTVDLRLAPVGQTRPVWIHRSGIPAANVRGNPRLFPRVNRVVLPPSATGAPNALFSFRVIESERGLWENDEAVPETDNLRFLSAFAVWDDILIPSFPIAAAMAHYGVTPEEVHVKMGDHIRIGDDGPIVAIDEFGQLAYQLVDQPKYLSTTAKTLIAPDTISRQFPGSAPRMVVFADATRTNPAPWENPRRLMRFVSSLDALPRPQAAEPHPRMPVWGEVLFLSLVAAAPTLFLRAARPLMPFVSVLVISLSVLCLLALLYFEKTWMPLAPVIVTGIVGGILAPRFALALPPRSNPAA